MAASNTPEGQLQYLMLILKNTDMPKPDYQKVAQDAGINNANNAQKRFKKIVEDAGFTLVEGKVTAPPVGTVAAAPNVGTAPKTTKKPRAKKNGADTPASKKRKLTKKDTEEDDAAGVDDEGVADIKDEAGAEASVSAVVSATAGDESG